MRFSANWRIRRTAALFVLAASLAACGRGTARWSSVLPVDADPETGYGYGVSAPFIGQLPDAAGGGVVVAGGCNFPDVPASRGGGKRYYDHIFRFDTATYSWRPAGRMARPLAYGASASTPEGVICAGGTDSAGRAVRDAFLLTGDGVRALAELPVAMDNCAGAYLEGRFYVAGDTAFCIYDLAADAWRRGALWPGAERRVQPVLVAQAGRVWLFGGYDPVGPGFVFREGYVYDPATDRWEAVAGPGDAEGAPLLAAGGAGVAWGGDSIVCFGGVNASVFTEALRRGRALAAEPDNDSLRRAQREYMEREPGWYRFNDRVLVYRPSTGVWTAVSGPAPESAGAGAGVTLIRLRDGTAGILLFNGELKPGVRTPEVRIFRP